MSFGGAWIQVNPFYFDPCYLVIDFNKDLLMEAFDIEIYVWILIKIIF